LTSPHCRGTLCPSRRDLPATRRYPMSATPKSKKAKPAAKKTRVKDLKAKDAAKVKGGFSLQKPAIIGDKWLKIDGRTSYIK
jgi:hypothetical protein